MKIAILGWGSLLWDQRADFDDQHENWQFDGPTLKLEFSRISQTRKNALTLILDVENGWSCRVAYALSKRKNPDDAICDLRSREGTTLENIGFCFVNGSRKQGHDSESFEIIRAWALEKRVDVVVWTDLASNFENKTGKTFSVDSALAHIQGLNDEGKANAAEYVWRAPQFITTPLRKALQTQPWFPHHG